MIAGASNRDSDFFDAVVTLMRRSSSRLIAAKSSGVAWGWARAGRRARQERAGKTDPHSDKPGIHGQVVHSLLSARITVRSRMFT